MPKELNPEEPLTTLTIELKNGVKRYYSNKDCGDLTAEHLRQIRDTWRRGKKDDRYAINYRLRPYSSSGIIGTNDVLQHEHTDCFADDEIRSMTLKVFKVEE